MTSLVAEANVPGDGARQARAGGEQKRLSRAFHPGKPDDLTRTGLEADILDLQALRFEGHAAQRQERLPGRAAVLPVGATSGPNIMRTSDFVS